MKNSTNRKILRRNQLLAKLLKNYKFYSVQYT